MFTVCVDWYSLEEGKVGQDRKPLARYQHRTLKAARRRLASIPVPPFIPYRASLRPSVP